MLELALAAKRDVLLVGPHERPQSVDTSFRAEVHVKLIIISKLRPYHFTLRSYKQLRYRDAEASGVQ